MTPNPSLPEKIGEFQIGRELGRGGMGVVYEAHQISLKRKVALKVLSGGIGMTQKAIARFRREAESAGRLHHTNIVPIYAIGEDNGIYFYAMELIDGPSLDQVIRKMRMAKESPAEENEDLWTVAMDGTDPDSQDLTQSFALRSVADSRETASESGSAIEVEGSTPATDARYFDTIALMIADVAEALQHAHDHGIIHRDIKPSNLLLGSDGRSSINDFGLARVLEEPGMTMTGEFVGTPRYMSPEQISAGRDPLDHRTDIYSLGATLYELLTLQPHVTGRNREELLAQVLHKEPVSPNKINRKIPTDLVTICLKALERDPDRRYQTAQEMATDLRAFVNRFAISARRTGPLGKSIRWVRRHPSRASLIAVTTLAILIIATVLYVNRINERDRANQRRLSKLADKQELVLVYSIGGDFVRARETLQEAQELGAGDDWIELVNGQIELISGNYLIANKHLENAGALGTPSLQLDALLTISHFYAGNETKYFESISKWQAQNPDFQPQTQEDYLYLGLMYSWADPFYTLDLLDQASKLGAAGPLLLMIRARTSNVAAMESVDLEKSSEFAKAAVEYALDIRDFPYLKDSSSVLQISSFAHTVAAFRCDQRNDESGKKRYLALAKLDLDKANSAHPLIFSRFHYLHVAEGEEQAIDFLLTLRAEKLANAILVQRIIARFRTRDLVGANKDFQAFTESDRIVMEPKRTMVEIACVQNDADLKKIRSRFSLRTKQRLALPQVSSMDVDWAVCRLLGLEAEASDIEVAIGQRAINYEKTFMADITRPFVQLHDGQSHAQIIEQCRGSRRKLAYGYFVAGIDSLTRGHRDQARQYFVKCKMEGYFTFWVCHWSRAILARMNEEPDWPNWIENRD